MNHDVRLLGFWRNKKSNQSLVVVSTNPSQKNELNRIMFSNFRSKQYIKPIWKHHLDLEVLESLGPSTTPKLLFKNPSKPQTVAPAGQGPFIGVPSTTCVDEMGNSATRPFGVSPMAELLLVFWLGREGTGVVIVIGFYYKIFVLNWMTLSLNIYIYMYI